MKTYMTWHVTDQRTLLWRPNQGQWGGGEADIHGDDEGMSVCNIFISCPPEQIEGLLHEISKQGSYQLCISAYGRQKRSKSIYRI
jgi:hypothetical protein